jgi:hypothetical protein
VVASSVEIEFELELDFRFLSGSGGSSCPIGSSASSAVVASSVEVEFELELDFRFLSGLGRLEEKVVQVHVSSAASCRDHEVIDRVVLPNRLFNVQRHGRFERRVRIGTRLFDFYGTRAEREEGPFPFT